MHHECGKLIYPYFAFMEDEYFEKDEKKVSGYPQ
jgi:hypothetical protein